MKAMPVPVISKEQIIKINTVARKEHGLDTQLLHDMVYEMTGKSSIRELSKYEAMDVIDCLTGKQPQNRPLSRASVAQIDYIKDLEKELGWQDNSKRLQGFIKKFAKTERLHWLTPKQASNVIEGLKSLLKNSHVQCQK